MVNNEFKEGDAVRIAAMTHLNSEDTTFIKARDNRIVGKVVNQSVIRCDTSKIVFVEFGHSLGMFAAEELEAATMTNDDDTPTMREAIDMHIGNAPDLAAQLAEAQRELAAAKGRIAALEAALKPFAEATDSAVTQTGQGYTRHLYVLDTHNEPKVVTVSEDGMLSINHLRAAHDALKAGRK